MTLEEARAIIEARLGAHFKDMVSEVTVSDMAALDAISEDTLRYGVDHANGNAEAAKNLEHLKAQVQMLGSTVSVREGKRINETLLSIAMIAGEVLGQVLKGVV